MADIKFSCPHCHQHITCDELWGGHQLQCPSCQGALTVPARPAPAAVPPPPPPPPPSFVPTAGSGSSHVFKAPGASAPKLAIGQAQAAAAERGAPGPAPAKSIPIRNLAPPKPKKANPVFTILKVVGVLAVLAPAIYFGLGYIRQLQDKSNAKTKAEEARNGGGESQVGHIANLNDVLDRTDPSHMGEASGVHSSGATTRPTGVGSEIPMADADRVARRSTGAGQQQPQGSIVAPSYTLDVNQARIPASRVNGTISGTNFVADAARIDPIGSAQVLRLIQGQATSPDRQILVYLHLKSGEKLGGQSLSVASDGHGPQVAKSWKVDPRYAALVKQFSTGYAMKLELGQVTNDTVTGQIYLALPDPEQTVVAGQFTANVATVDPNARAYPVATPLTRPMTPADQQMRDRYGLKK